MRASIILLLIAIVCAPSRLAAQDASVIDSLFATDTTVVAVPIGSIPTEALEASNQLWSMRNDAMLSDWLETVRTTWNANATRIQALKRETRESLESGADREWLVEIERQWTGIQSDLKGRLGSLSGRAAALDDDLKTLATMQRKWTMTQSAARKAMLPASVLARIDSVTYTIGALQPLVKENLDQVLDLEAVLAQESQEADRILKRIHDETLEEWSAYTRPDQRSLVTLLFEPGQEAQLAERRQAYSQMRFRGAIEFLGRHRRAAMIHVFIFLLLALLMRTLQRWMERWRDSGTDLPLATLVLALPYSCALFVALVSTELIYPGTPVTLIALALVISIAPTYRLLALRLPAVLNPALRTYIGFLLVVVAIDVFVSDATIAGRFIYLGLTVVAGAGVAWFLLRGASKDRLATTATGRRVIAALRIAFTLLIVSVISALSGYGALSIHLTTATIYSLYFLILVYVGALIAKAVLFGLLRSPYAYRSKVVSGNFDLISSRLGRIVNVLAILEGAHVVLERFGIGLIVIDWLGGVLTASVSIGEVQFTIGDIFLFILTFWAALLVARFIRFILDEEVFTRVRMGRGRPQAITGTLYYIMVVLGFVFALSAIGMPMDRLTVLAGAFGIGIGFGLQDVVNNFVSGLILLYEGPVQLGDTIEFGTRMGIVRHIGIRSSVVRTFEGAEVSVPNSHLVSNEVVNWTLSDKLRRFSIVFGVAYGTDVGRIPDVILPLAQNNPRIDNQPEPVLLFTAMGDSSLNFELRCWTTDGNWPSIKSQLTEDIYSALGEAGIEIPFPQRDLHIRSGIDLSSSRLSDQER